MAGLLDLLDIFTKPVQWTAEHNAAVTNMGELARSAAMEDANAVAAARRGSLEAGLYRARGTLTNAEQRVGYTVGNVDATTGTAADVQAGAAIFSELDALTARNNARRAALGHAEVARRYRMQADELGRKYVYGGILGGGSAQDAMVAGSLKSAIGAAVDGFGGQ
jgi:hypothetical protein